MKHLLFILITVSAMLFVACAKENAPQSNETGDVYISVVSSTRAQSGSDTFNGDTDDMEDRVENLAILIFDNSTKKLVTAHYHGNIPEGLKQKEVVMKIPGDRYDPNKRYDFYFFGNLNYFGKFSEPWLEQNVASQAYTSTKMKELFFNGIGEVTPGSEHLLGGWRWILQSDTKGKIETGRGTTVEKGTIFFPMVRAYENQVILKGGTEGNPIPFKPDRGTPQEDDFVRLKRRVIKVEIVPKNVQVADQIQSAVLHNISHRFHLEEKEFEFNPTKEEGLDKYETTDVPSPVAMKEVTVGGIKRWRAYGPEMLNTTAGLDRWNDTNKTKGITYVKITLTNGKIYDIPVLGEKVPAGTNFWEFAKGPDAAGGSARDFKLRANNYYEISILGVEIVKNITYDVKMWDDVAVDIPPFE